MLAVVAVALLALIVVAVTLMVATPNHHGHGLFRPASALPAISPPGA